MIFTHILIYVYVCIAAVKKSMNESKKNFKELNQAIKAFIKEFNPGKVKNICIYASFFPSLYTFMR